MSLGHLSCTESVFDCPAVHDASHEGELIIH